MSTPNSTASITDSTRAGRFLLVVVLCLSGLLGLGVLVVAVDPYLLFDSPRVDGVNRWKTRFFFAPYGTYGSKPRHVYHFGAHTIVLGSSTAGGSLRPDHPAIKRERVFNYALAGSTPQVQLASLQLAMRSNPVTSVILCVDLFAYNAFIDNPRFQQYIEAVNAPTTAAARWRQWRRDLESRLSEVFSYPVLADAWQTVVDQRHPGVGGAYRDLREDGFWQNPRPTSWSQLLSFSVIERQYLTTGWFPEPRRRFAFAAPGERSPFTDVQALLDEVRRRHVTLNVVIMPFHARLAEAMHAVGLWDDFEELKRRMVDLAEKSTGGDKPATIVVWDFSGYNDVTMETIKGASEDSRWFEDAIHPSVATGDLMLSRIFGPEGDVASGLPDFGIRLRRDHLDDLLRQVTRRRQEYLHRHAADVDDVRKSIAQTRAYRDAAYVDRP